MVRGQEATGWAGLDDFEFHFNQTDCEIEPSNAKPPDTSTTPPPPDNLCNFETDFCHWEALSSSDFKWNRVTGQDIIDNGGHGPMEDEDGNKVRYFVNVDAVNAQVIDATASLKSPLWQAAEHDKECFSFSFNLENSNSAIQELKIQLLDERAENRDIWRIMNPNGELEKGWHQGQVLIEPLNQDVNYWVCCATSGSF